MKKAISVLLAVVLLVGLLPCFAIPVSADSLYIRKVVSVVFDDSGSMDPFTGAKWANANYALQTFCGMLNSEDQLYITYMSGVIKSKNYSPKQVDLSSGGIQQSVDAIREHDESARTTPYAAVRTAYNKLTQVQDTNPNTQYWLVVITDGDYLDEVVNKDTLDKRLNEYTGGSQKMANGTYPQITYMGIGTKITMPTENPSKGIYTYTAADANGIIETMSDMADRISGRTRVDKGSITKVSDTTVRVSSNIPLLNIAVLSQRTEAKIVKAGYTNESDIPIGRQATLKFPGHKDLVGSAYLVGDSQNVIASGSYDITFDRAVNLDDLVILFEPALETRMTITLNGTPVTDYSELANAMEGDKVSVSCKLYEMGTNKEIDPSLLPPGTKFQVLVRENGQEVVCEVGEEMELNDYTLKNIDTELVAQVIIDGFKPIEYYEKFTPTPYVPRVVYTMDAAFVNGVKSIKLDDLAANKDMALEFTVYADGVAMTDPAAVQALKPTIVASPTGNMGNVTFSPEGKIVYTPNAAPQPALGTDAFDVQVSCTLENGVTANATYTVLVALYEVVPLSVSGTIRKNEFYGNAVGASFYITKDGVRLTKSEVEAQAAGVLNETYAHLETRIDVAADGTITIVPHDPQERKLNAWTWLWNWWWYWFEAPNEDVAVTLSHAYGTATTVIDVVEADVGYVIWNVVAPLVVLLLFATLIAMYAWGNLTQPWFQEGAALYVGTLRFEDNQDGYSGVRGHKIRATSCYELSEYNSRLWYLIPWPVAPRIELEEGIVISPMHGEPIRCHFRAWMRTKIRPVADGVAIHHPNDLLRLASGAKTLHIEEIQLKATNIVEEQIFDSVSVSTYCVAPDADGVTQDERNITTIKKGKIVAYAYIQ